jgi:K+-transporting ATPase ATPase B chain
MRLATPESAILSAVIFNALVIVGLIPLALRGVRYRALPASTLLRHHLLGEPRVHVLRLKLALDRASAR